MADLVELAQGLLGGSGDGARSRALAELRGRIAALEAHPLADMIASPATVVSLTAKLVSEIEARVWKTLTANRLEPGPIEKVIGSVGNKWAAIFTEILNTSVITGLGSLSVAGREEIASLVLFRTARKLEASGELSFQESASAGTFLTVEANPALTLQRVLQEGFEAVTAGQLLVIENKGVNAFTIEHNFAASGGFFLSKEANLELKPGQLLILFAIQGRWRNSVAA